MGGLASSDKGERERAEVYIVCGRGYSINNGAAAAYISIIRYIYAAAPGTIATVIPLVRIVCYIIPSLSYRGASDPHFFLRFVCREIEPPRSPLETHRRAIRHSTSGEQEQNFALANCSIRLQSRLIYSAFLQYFGVWSARPAIGRAFLTARLLPHEHRKRRHSASSTNQLN